MKDLWFDMMPYAIAIGQVLGILFGFKVWYETCRKSLDIHERACALFGWSFLGGIVGGFLGFIWLFTVAVILLIGTCYIVASLVKKEDK